MFYKAVGFVQQINKDTWDKFMDNAVFSCPDNENPYIYLTKDYPQAFSHWLVEFQKININKE